MRRFLGILIWSLAFLYGCALLLFAIGTFGWFEAERDPLGAVFVIPLGLPWNLMLDGAPEAAGPWIGALAPLVSVALLVWLRRWVVSSERQA